MSDKQQQITISTASYFPGMWTALGVIIAGVSGALLVTGSLWGLLLAPLPALILTARYRTTIHLKIGEVDEHIFIAGLKADSKITKVEKISHIYINKARFSQVLNSRTGSRTIYGTMYTAFLATDQENFNLGESQNGDKLIERMKGYAGQLGIKLLIPRDL